MQRRTQQTLTLLYVRMILSLRSDLAIWDIACYTLSNPVHLFVQFANDLFVRYVFRNAGIKRKQRHLCCMGTVVYHL